MREALESLESRDDVGALLASEPSIAEIDLNPGILYPEGKGMVALDALTLVQ